MKTHILISRKDLIILVSCFVVLCFTPEPVFAVQTATENTLDIISKFKEATAPWEGKLTNYTKQLFMLLFALDIAFLGVKASLEGTQKSDILKSFIMLLLFGGFVLAVINNYQDWAGQIIGGMQEISSSLTNQKMAAAKPFQIGLALCGKILSKISGWSPINSLGFAITGLVIIFCFALLSAQVIYIKCSCIISLAASMILLGFGGSSFTKEYAINTMRLVLAIAFRLFVIELLLGVGGSIIESFDVSDDPTYEDLFSLIGASLILLTLVTKLPDELASLVSGTQIGSGTALLQTAGAVGSMVAGVGAMGAGLAGAPVNAMKSMSSANQLANMDGKSGLGKIAHMGKTLMNSHQQANADMPGQSTLKRMNSNMKGQIQARKHGQNVEQNVGGVSSNSNGE